MKGLDIQYYDEGWRYGRLLSHDGQRALIECPQSKGKLWIKRRVKLDDIKVYREAEGSRMPDFLEEHRPGNPEAKGEAPMADEKKATKKRTKKAKPEVKQRAGSRILALSAGTELKDFKEGSHGYFVVKALGKLGKGTAAEITAEAVAQGFKTTMDPAKAIAWMANKLFTEKKLKQAGETKPVEMAA